MIILRQRRFHPVNIGPAHAHEEHRIESMTQARCASCEGRWALDQLKEKDGRWYCPNDYDEMNPREAAEQLANDLARGAQYPVRWLTIQPALQFDSETPLGAITALTDGAGRTVSPGSPLSFTKGGAAVTLKLGGVQFSSADTIAYSSGISNNVSPVVTSTLITLSLVASGGMTAGDNYSLTFNGTVFRNIFRVR